MPAERRLRLRDAGLDAGEHAGGRRLPRQHLGERCKPPLQVFNFATKLGVAFSVLERPGAAFGIGTAKSDVGR